jgi:hypothetical protein
MSNHPRTGASDRPQWFADFEQKLVDLIRTSPGAQTQDLGACLTVLIPRGGGANNAFFGGLVTARDGRREQIREELLTAVVWALLADGVLPESLRETFEHSMQVAEGTAALTGSELDDFEDEVVN